MNYPANHACNQRCTHVCNQGRSCTCGPTEAASACTEIGADQYEPRRKRLGRIGPVHRLILAKQPTYTVAAITVLAIVAAVVRGLP